MTRPKTRQMMNIAMDMFAYALFFGNGFTPLDYGLTDRLEP